MQCFGTGPGAGGERLCRYFILQNLGVKHFLNVYRVIVTLLLR